MFLVFNKQKIYSYLVALSMVIVLFGIATIYTNRNTTAILTSNSGRELPIYNVETADKKISLTMNCAWSWSQLSEIEK